MSQFERACWSWYLENVNQFAVEMGIVCDAVKEEGLTGATRRFFFNAMNIIHRTFAGIRAENAQGDK